MKIKEAHLNLKKKAIEITTNKKEQFSLPFVKLPRNPTLKNPIVAIIIDAELDKRAVTLTYKSGEEDSVHLDAFLEYNQDPSYLRDCALHELTLKAVEYLKISKLSKNEIVRRLETSPSQLYRLLDPSNTRKSLDEVLRLLSILGCRVEWRVLNKEKAA